MAKTNSLQFSPLFLGLFLVLIISLGSECVNAGCTDFYHSATHISIHTVCQDECTSFFGDKLLTHEVHDLTWLGRYQCKCCYED
ncbi:hypothetical protein C5167_041249 [Papaver somniferum]|uniref:C2H2-type domain-containing protein n=1 Tax=Papaver somniferum TaxID=3469 RepID=A0A4Y7IKI3_PAPSO|nr:hypothetical protein C5167_041249 [Papaver somniferum]